MMNRFKSRQAILFATLGLLAGTLGIVQMKQAERASQYNVNAALKSKPQADTKRKTALKVEQLPFEAQPASAQKSVPKSEHDKSAVRGSRRKPARAAAIADYMVNGATTGSVAHGASGSALADAPNYVEHNDASGAPSNQLAVMPLSMPKPGRESGSEHVSETEAEKTPDFPDSNDSSNCESLPNPLTGSRFARMAAAHGVKLPQSSDPVSAAVIKLYGATFVVPAPLKAPPRAIFDRASEARAYQKKLPLKRFFMTAYGVTLQKQASDALLQAHKEAQSRNLVITPAGDVASLRSYEDTSRIWHKYLEKGLDYWVKRRKISPAQAAQILQSRPREQLAQVMALEQQGIYLHASHIHSIMNLCAPPGSSQHISGLALDIKEHQNCEIRALLNKYGWYQVVAHDFPHFVYLGVPERDLPQLGLTPVLIKGRQFWLPDA